MTTGLKGIYYDRSRKSQNYRAMKYIPGNDGKKKQFHIGYFATLPEASKAYNDYIKKHC